MTRRKVCEANAPLVLENNRADEPGSIYNVSIANDVSLDRLMSVIEELYDHQQCFSHQCVARCHTEVYSILQTLMEQYIDQPFLDSRQSDLKKLIKQIDNLRYTR